MENLFDSTIFTWVIIPLLIFLARIMDVTLGTMRIMFLARGNKFIAPLLGFFEISIWLIAIRQIMQNLSNPACFLAYALGYTLGNFIGIMIEEKAAVGKIVVRIITKKDAAELIKKLNIRGFGATSMDAEGAKGRVNVIYSIIDRYNLERVVKLINQYNPKAFYTIEDTRGVNQGIFPLKRKNVKQLTSNPPRLYRKFRYLKRRRSIRKSK